LGDFWAFALPLLLATASRALYAQQQKANKKCAPFAFALPFAFASFAFALPFAFWALRPVATSKG
jgi:hypothetical protein